MMLTWRDKTGSEGLGDESVEGEGVGRFAGLLDWVVRCIDEVRRGGWESFNRSQVVSPRSLCLWK